MQRDKDVYLDCSEGAESLLDPILAEVRALLEQHQASILMHITDCVSHGLSNRDAHPGASILGNKHDFAPPDLSIQALDPVVPKGGSMDADMFLPVCNQSAPAHAQSPKSPSSTKAERDRYTLSRTISSSILQPKGPVGNLVSKKYFELACGFLILLNSVIIGVDVEVNKDTPFHHKPRIFFISQCFFCVAFTVELILRMIAEGYIAFFTTSRHVVWNYIDLVIVASTIVELTIHIVLLSLERDHVDKHLLRMSNVKIMRVLRVLRLLRTLRMARVLRFVRQLRLLVHSIVSTLYALGWSMVLMLMIIYVFAVLFTEDAMETLSRSSALEVAGDNLADVDRFFRSLPVSMYTLFKSICGGLDWDEPATALSKVSLVSMYLYTAYVAFVYFAVLNVVTAVFCTCAIESNVRDHENALHEQIKSRRRWRDKLANLFEDFDEDQTRLITMSEFEKGLKNEHVQAHLASLELEAEDAWTLFELLDTDKTQTIDLEEFVLGCLRLKGTAKSMDVAKLMYDSRIMAKKQEHFMESVETKLNHLAARSAHTMRCLSLLETDFQRCQERTIKQSEDSVSMVVKPTEGAAAEFTAGQESDSVLLPEMQSTCTTQVGI